VGPSHGKRDLDGSSESAVDNSSSRVVVCNGGNLEGVRNEDR
jgi:hypothetical protein